MSTIEVMRKALNALENSVDLVQAEYTDNWRHGLPTRAAQLDGLKRLAEDHASAIEALRAEIERMESTPIAPSIPALTIEEVAEGAPEFADVPKYGPAYLAGAHWAYTLAAARCGARIIKADPLQELADDARQIGLEY